MTDVEEDTNDASNSGAATAATTAVEVEEDEDENGDANVTCMICMEEWTIGSDHRLCCLKCGHLFGRSCIERWIKEKGAANAKCPSCNKPAKKGDLRDLWCKTIKAADTTELCNLQQQLKDANQQRKTDSAIIFHSNLKLEMLHEEVVKLKKQIVERDNKISRLESILDRYNKLRAQKLAAGSTGNEGDVEEQELLNLQNDEEIEIDLTITPQEMKGFFSFAGKIDSSAQGCNKTFALCPTSSTILLTQPTPSNFGSLYRNGYGLRRYSVYDTSKGDFIPLHTKLINSMQLKPVGDLILTSGQDKKIFLTSLNNNTCVQSYTCDNEPSCVAWSTHRDQQFYVASQNCYVTLYDMRNTSEPVYQTSERVAKTLLLSIAATTSAQDDLNGLLVNDIKGSQWLEISDSSHYETEVIDRSIEHLHSYNLPFEGLMGSVDFNSRLDMALITTRTTPLDRSVSHNLVRLKKIQNDEGQARMDCKLIKCFTGGKCENPLLSQSRILRHPTLDDHVLVGACDQQSGSIKLWDTSDGRLYQSIKTNSFTRDMLLHTPANTNQHLLYTLSDRGLSIYRWDYA